MGSKLEGVLTNDAEVVEVLEELWMADMEEEHLGNGQLMKLPFDNDDCIDKQLDRKGVMIEAVVRLAHLKACSYQMCGRTRGNCGSM